MSDRNIFIIHGIGTQCKGYSDKMIESIRKGADTSKTRFIEVNYADILDTDIRAYTQHENAVKHIDSPELRRMFNETAYDAISYGYKRSRVLKRIKDIFDRYNTGGENSFIAHSLGGLVLFDFLSRYKIRAKNIFTLGTPLALRLIKAKCDIDVEFWLNIVGSSDVIGKPLKTALLNIEQCSYDYVAPIGSFIQRRTPLAHTAYWDDDNVIKPIVYKLIADIKGKFDEKKYLKSVEDIWRV